MHPLKLSSRSSRIALFLGVIIIVSLTCVLIVDRRNTSEWEKVQAALLARGETLQWNAFIPSPVPDADNFYAAPIFTTLVGYKGAPPPKTVADTTETKPKVQFASAILAKPESRSTRPTFPPNYPASVPYPIAYLKELPRTAADDKPSFDELDNWLSLWDDEFDQLREAMRRPFAQPIGNYQSPETVPLPNFVQVRNVVQILGTRARIHFMKGERAEGMKDLDAIAGFIRVLDTPHANFINSMIAVAIAGLYTGVVHDLITEGLATDVELARIAEQIAKFNLFAQVQAGLREGERAGIVYVLDDLAADKNPKQATALLTGPGKLTREALFTRFAPRGWVRRNQAHYAMIVQNYIETIDPKSHRFYPEKNDFALSEMSSAFSEWSPYTAIAQIVTPRLDRALSTTGKNQARLDMARVVCALERHRLKHKTYPATLAPLAPEFITVVPHDIATGQPLIYKADGAKFSLYSVGSNRKDDGGLSDTNTLDWVWGP